MLSLLMLPLWGSGGVAHARETVTLTSGEWPPYISEEFKFGGFATKVATEAFARAGYDVKYVYMPWKRGLESVISGEFAGAMGWSRTEERALKLHYSDPIFAPETVFFHRKEDGFDWQTLKDVGDKTIGATLGYSYNEFLEPVVRKGGGKLDIAPTDVMNLLKLADGRVDIFPCAKAVGYYLLRAKLLPGLGDGITHHPRTLMQKSIHIVFSKKVKNAEEILRRFNEALQQLHEEGLFEQYEMESLRGDYLPERR